MALESGNGSTLANGQANRDNEDSAMAARSHAFGEMFVQRRQRLGLTLQEVSSFTKLHPRFLKAIEQGDFSKLPGGILTKSFIRSYAQEIGLDDSQAVSEYLAITGQAPPEPVLEPTTFDPQNRGSIGENPAGKSRSALLSISLVALLFLIASSGSFLLGRHYKGLFLLHSHSSPTAPPLSVESEVDAKSQVDTPSATTTPPVTTGSPVTAASIQSSPAEASGTSSTSQPDPDLTPKASELTPEECATNTICVQINARENAWVSVTVDGKTIMHSTLVAPTRKLIAAQRHLVVRAGNVGALDFRFNGVQLPSQGDYDEAKTLNFSPNGLVRGAPTPNPTTQTD